MRFLTNIRMYCVLQFATHNTYGCKNCFQIELVQSYTIIFTNELTDFLSKYGIRVEFIADVDKLYVRLVDSVIASTLQ